MAIYQNILLAVDLHPEHDDPAAERAIEIAKKCGSKIYVVHAFEGIHAYGITQGYNIIMELEATLADEVRKLLSHFSDKYDIAPERQIFRKGPPNFVILEQAQELNIDLIVVGSHSRHGLQLLFGTTADGIIHDANCDVLAVRLKNVVE